MSRSEDVRALTGLRGVAVTQVVFYHYLESSNAGVLQPLVARGYVAVDLFFVLSGFVMALNYAEALRSFDARAYLDFLWKRAGRIYPLYLFGLGASLVLGLAGLKSLPEAPSTVLTNLLLVQAWGWGPSLNGPTWSISTEFATYILFPVLALAALHRRARWVAGAAALGLLVFVATRTDADLGQASDLVLRRHGPLDIYEGTTPFPLLRCIAGFTWGLITYGLAGEPAVRRRLDGHAAALALGLLALVFAGPATDIAIVILFAPLIIALCGRASRATAVLGSGPLYTIGIISYSIYVNHRLLNTLLREPLAAGLGALEPATAWMVAGILETIPLVVVSFATYRWIEEPARRWSREVLHRPPTLIAPEARAT